MPETSQPGSPGIGAAAAAVIAPDAATAAILAKHAARQPLTPQESGKLGWWRSQLNKLKGGAAGDRAGSAQPGPIGGQPARMAPLVASQAPADGLAAVPVDADLVKRTTAAVLKSADTIARRYIGREARKAGADDKTALRFDAAVRLPDASQELLVDTSPEILEALGLDARTYPMVVAIGCLGLWGTNIWLAIDELKALQKHVIPANSVVSPAPAAGAWAGPTIPIPPSPPGAPPNVTAKEKR